jgi:NADPH:quinone reductase-like Zn-dependent oxidoreductase
LYQTLKIPLPNARPQETYHIFVYGGSTAMGISAIQFAKLSGATVITTSSPNNAKYVESIGADHVLDYKSTTLTEDVLRLANGPVNFVFDTYPSKTSTALAASIMAKSTEARYVALVPGFEEDVQRLNPYVKARSILAYSAFGEPWMYEKKLFEAIPEDFEFQKEFVKMAEKFFAGGLVKPPRIYLNRGGSGLAGILRGLEEVREGRVSGGKLVYTREHKAASGI